MRSVLIGLAVLVTAGAVYAQDYTSSEYCDPWCHVSSKLGKSCNYRTFEQCLASIPGLGGDCEQNPFLSMCRRGPGAATTHHRRHHHNG